MLFPPVLQQIERVLHLFVVQPLACGNAEMVAHTALQRPFADVQRICQSVDLVCAAVERGI